MDDLPIAGFVQDAVYGGQGHLRQSRVLQFIGPMEHRKGAQAALTKQGGGQPGGLQPVSLLPLLGGDCLTAPRTIKPSTRGSQSAWKRQSSVASRSPWSSSKLIQNWLPDRCNHLDSASLLAEATNCGRFTASALVFRGNWMQTEFVGISAIYTSSSIWLPTLASAAVANGDASWAPVQ